MLRGRLTALSAAFAALALVGCGGGDGGGQAAGSQGAPGGGSTGGGASGSGGSGGAGSSQAPTARARPADAASLRVIRGWSDALRRGQVNRATDYFALPSVVENASPPVKLRARRDARAFNRSLPCGARLQRAYRIGGYTAAVFVLTERPGGDCGTGTGNQAATAFVIRRGKIVEWRRLADPPTGGETPPSIAPGTQTTPTLTGPVA